MISDPPVSLWPDPSALGPLTDLYQITMMAGYHAAGIANERATFEAFARKLPEHRAYLVAAGLEQAIGDLLRLGFSADQIEAIRSVPAFSKTVPGFFDWLGSLRFEGDVWAIPEGTLVFPGEPLVRVEAPLAQAQWVETLLLASIGYATLVASKAARIVEAAEGRPVYDFGARRGQGPHAGMIAARSAYLAGCAGTSLVEAARRLGIPASGTMAHSWVQAFPSEAEAFETFARLFPDASTMLVDTYDTEAAVRTVSALPIPFQAIRIDSGDLGAQAAQARRILDGAGRGSVRIVASGDLDEWKIRELVRAGSPIDAFGVGTEMVTSRDAPALAIVYKLVELGGVGRIKKSPGKRTYPGAKQVFRTRDQAGHFSADRVAMANEACQGQPLVVPILRGGRLVEPLPRLDSIRDLALGQRTALPARLRRLDAEADYPVTYSEALGAEAERLA